MKFNHDPKHLSFPSACGKMLLYALLPGFLFVAAASAQTKPNIVVILADDLGYGDVGFDGATDIPTPNIDALAANGIKFTDGYVTEPFCAPSRAAILTGRYQQRFGFEAGPENDNLNPLLGLPQTETTLAELLKPAGYVCGAIGKWHLGTSPKVFPTNRGFDSFVGFLDAEAKYYNVLLYRNKTLYTETTYLTDAFTREAVSFIDTNAKKPFFLYLAYNAVHKPYDTPPDEYVQKVSYIPDPVRRNYAAMCVALDAGVGTVMQELQNQGLLDNTLVFFLSDNGAPNSPGTTQSNAPLRGYKTNVLEGGIRIPFAMQWSSHLPTSVTYTTPVSSLDIFATAAAVAGVPLPTDRAYDGLDILPYLEAQQPLPDRNLFWRWFGLGPTGPLGSLNTIYAVRSGSLKLVVERAKDTEPPALYDLSKDIGETTDLSTKEPTQVSDLASLYSQWELNLIPPIWQKDSDTILLPVVLAGDWNGFNITDPNPPWNLTEQDAPNPQGAPDGYNRFINTIHVASSGGDTTPGTHSFTIVGTGSYSLQWGGANINVDGLTDIPAYSGSHLGPSNTINFLDNSYYSMRIIDTKLLPAPRQDLEVAFMKTSAPPVTVSLGSQVPENPTPTDPITVNIKTSAPKSPEEKIYVRWSNDWFITSQMVLATGSGRKYTATIPPQPATASVLYSIVTSTADLTPYSDSATIDELTLSLDGVYNAVPPILPAITQQPRDQTAAVGQSVSFRVRANGTDPLAYQWRKNGADIAGATRSTYHTPPTTPDDDGALFSVVVSNRGGSAISSDATLTIRSQQ